MTHNERLYGLTGAEILHGDIASLWEYELCDEVTDAGNIIVEEWTVVPIRNHLPSRHLLLELICEWVDEWGDVIEQWVIPTNNHDINTAADNLLDTIAAKITGRVGDQIVDEHLLEWDVGGENPKVNGKPLYRKVEGGER